MTKKGGWFRQSERHSLASRGVKTKAMKAPRTPKAPSKARTVDSGGSHPKGDEVVMLCAEDEQFGLEFVDSNGTLLKLVGAVVDEADKPKVLILETKTGERVERKPEDLRPADKE
jgi:hypothetical protein